MPGQPTPLVPPPGVRKSRGNRETAQPTTAADPRAIEEYFIEGAETRTLGDGEAPAPVAPSRSAPPEPVPDDIRRQIF